MKILLTGGAGYIGSHTAVELIECGHETVIVDNYSNSSPEVINRIEKITGKRPVVYEADVRDKDSLDRIFKEHKIDGVIHFAGLKAVGESVKIPLKYYRCNIDSTLSLLECMEKHGVEKIIFSSSATVYGEPEKLPCTEDMKTGPCSNPYGWTKLMIEQILTDHAFSRPGFSPILLRYFNPVGAHPSGLIGEHPNGIPNNLMPFVTQVAVGKLKELKVFGNDYNTPDGTGVRDYIHVCDLAKAHVAAMKYCMDHEGVEIFNAGTGYGISVLDLVNTFSKVNEVPVPYVIAPRRAGDLDANYADPEKANRLLGWKAEKDLRDMVRDSWNWQKNNPNGYDK
ncbi:MAG: UDP-glucose 4-epimerase GalE [Ruminococcaceae bacterium]|nr:UDP-glucose 4-epimerase GalE [Oscillospiraceae bacterium]